MAKLKVHKIPDRLVSNPISSYPSYPVVVCGAITTWLRASSSWAKVTCINCLRAKPEDERQMIGSFPPENPRQPVEKGVRIPDLGLNWISPLFKRFRRILPW